MKKFNYILIYSMLVTLICHNIHEYIKGGKEDVVKTSSLSYPSNFEKISYNVLPKPAVEDEKQSEKVEAVWNRFTVNKFSIHSIDEEVGKRLSEEIVHFKNESLKMWGFPLIDYETETRIFICPNQEILNKLFNIENSAFEYREDRKVVYVWMVLNNDNYHSFQTMSMSIALIQLENKFNYEFPLWIHRGMPILSASLDKAKESVKLLSDLNQIQTIKYVTNLTDTDYRQLDADGKTSYKKQYDATAAFLCLFIRKEFGQSKFHLCMLKNIKIESVLGFSSYDELDNKFTYYCVYLRDDFLKNRLNDNYLTIKSK